MKHTIAFLLAVFLLLMSGCSAGRLPMPKHYEYDASAFPHGEGTGRQVTEFSEQLPAEEAQNDVSPESYMEAVSLMEDKDFAAAAELLDTMGTYRNANHLADICHGMLDHDYDKAVTAMQWVDALETFTYDDEHDFQNYDLTSFFWNLFDDHENDESVEGLNTMLEAIYYDHLADYDEAFLVGDEVSADYTISEENLLTFFNTTVSGWMDEELLENCKGQGTGKVLIAEKGKGSGNSFKLMFSNMTYALPTEKLPKELSEVEYVLFVNDDYDTIGVYTNGAVGIRYKITFTVRQYPGGKVIYDSGVLIGDDPDETVTVTGPIASVPGKLPDMTEALASIEEVLGLSYAD